MLATARATARKVDPLPSLAVPRAPWKWSRTLAYLVVVGSFLTFRGYHAFDGDQAYRLPLLLHWTDPATFANDPFVRAFDVFNPHRGYLALLWLASQPLGLAAGLFGLFAATLLITGIGIDWLARVLWPERGKWVGLVALGLFLAAKAGNIGTNHLFESTLLDRLIGFALGWLAIAAAVSDPRRGAWLSPVATGLATLIHPSVGLQLGLTLSAAWVVWGVLGESVSRRLALVAIGATGLAALPGLSLTLGQSGKLLEGLSTEDFYRLAVQVQGPQHMLPSTWPLPRWLAFGCYPILAGLAFLEVGRPWSAARVRMATLMVVNLLSLAVAYLAVEVVQDLRVTIFQPFRMATVARGLALVAVAGRLVQLWNQGDLASRSRATLIAVGLGGDWSLVVATGVDLVMEIGRRVSPQVERLMGLVMLSLGLLFLARHDTESGHVPLLAGLAALGVGTLVARIRPWTWNRRRAILVVCVVWVVPVGALVAGLSLKDPSASFWAGPLVARCRFVEVPTDDLERLAVWARENTPSTSRFIGPPGPKTFRLWSRRDLAFNRASSPYHAVGLADWASRFRDHVNFSGSTSEFVQAYLNDRHALEARYQAMSDQQKAELAQRQGADHVLAAAPSPGAPRDPSSPLELLKVEGRYAVYRVR
jgi:hypothetical protein